MVVSEWVMNFSPYEHLLLRTEIGGVWEWDTQQNIYVALWKRKSNKVPRKLVNKELHDLWSSPNIFRAIKSSRMRWTELVANVGEKEHVIWGRKLTLFVVFSVLYFLKERKKVYDIIRLCARAYLFTRAHTCANSLACAMYMCLYMYMCYYTLFIQQVNISSLNFVRTLCRWKLIFLIPPTTYKNVTDPRICGVGGHTFH
jgi:hypothetical protein